jgi:hypothetical protein
MDFSDILGWDLWQQIAGLKILFRSLVDHAQDHWQNFEADIEGSGRAFQTYAYNNKVDAVREVDAIQEQATKISEYEQKIR